MKRKKLFSIILICVLFFVFTTELAFNQSAESRSNNNTSTNVLQSQNYSDINDFRNYKQEKTYTLYDFSTSPLFYNDSTIYKKSVDINWPISIKGCKEVDRLQNVLLKELFDNSYPSIDIALKNFWDDVPRYDEVGRYYPEDSISLEVIHQTTKYIKFKTTKYINLGSGNRFSSHAYISIIKYNIDSEKIRVIRHL